MSSINMFKEATGVCFSYTDYPAHAKLNGEMYVFFLSWEGFYDVNIGFLSGGWQV